MANFIFVYHGGSMPESEIERDAVMSAWQNWFAGMGEAVVDGGAPVGMSTTVSSDGVADNGGSNPVSGYSIIAAETQDAAAELAKGCPHLGSGGTVEIAPIMEM